MASNGNNESNQLRQNNPYSVGVIFQFPEGDVLLDRTPITVLPSQSDRYYTVEQGETLWTIAGRKDVYGEAKFYWILADVNQIDNPLDITPGITLTVPTLASAILST